MLYQSEKVRIRPFEKEDISERYRSWFHDHETTRFNSHGLFPYSREQMQAFVAALEGNRSRIVWAIEILKDGDDAKKELDYRILHKNKPIDNLYTHVGNASLQSINYINRSAELAIVIGEAGARNKGVGLQVCRWLLDHAFLKLGCNRVWTGTAATNVGMRRVCEKLGMMSEGAFTDGMFLDGKFVDVMAYGMTRKRYDLVQLIKNESEGQNK